MRSLQTGIYLLCATLLIQGMGNAQSTNNVNNTKNKKTKMVTMQKNTEVIRELYEQCLNKRNMALLQDFVSEDYVGIRGVKGAAGFEAPVTALISAVPDIRWKVEEIIAEENKVAVKWITHGTHTGQFQHIEATGETISNDGMAIFEFKDGKIISTRVLTDRLGFLQQLDVLPTDLALLPAKKTGKDQVRFIDKFFVPAKGKQEFLERVAINRNFIKYLPGFIEDAAYERTDEQGNLIYLTIAVWQSEEAVKKAKEAVQAEYKKEGFDLAGMLERLNITMDRGMYKEAPLQP